MPALPATHDRTTRPAVGRRARRRPPRRPRRTHTPRLARCTQPCEMQPGTRRCTLPRITRHHQSRRARTNSRRSHRRNTRTTARTIGQRRANNATTTSKEWRTTRTIRAREYAATTTNKQLVRRMARFSPFTSAQRPADPSFFLPGNAPFRDVPTLTCENTAQNRRESARMSGRSHNCSRESALVANWAGTTPVPELCTNCGAVRLSLPTMGGKNG